MQRVIGSGVLALLVVACSGRITTSQPVNHAEKDRRPSLGMRRSELLVGWAWPPGDRVTVRYTRGISQTIRVVVHTSSAGRFHIRVRYNHCSGTSVTTHDRSGRRATLVTGGAPCY